MRRQSSAGGTLLRPRGARSGCHYLHLPKPAPTHVRLSQLKKTILLEICCKIFNITNTLCNKQCFWIELFEYLESTSEVTQWIIDPHLLRHAGQSQLNNYVLGEKLSFSQKNQVFRK